MNVRCERKQKGLVISVSGKVNAATAEDFENALQEAVSEDEMVCVLNLSELEFISSAGLRGILMVAKQMKARQGHLSVVGLKGPAREVFEISGLISLFELYPTEEAALEAV